MPTPSLYDSDFFAWANQQAALLRAGQLSAADIENIAEEIESMGRGRSWKATITVQRHALADTAPQGQSKPQIRP